MPTTGLYNSGDKYGKLTLTGKSYTIPRNNAGSYRYVEAFCECGNIGFYRFASLRIGKRVSCGCKQQEGMKPKHGFTSNKKIHPVYSLWQNMLQRCNNKKNTHYKNYGGRGIKVCREWELSFELFYKYVGDRPSNKHTLDRINNDGNYEPSNVRWATRKEQAGNLRTNNLVTAFGETKCLGAWATDCRCSVSSSTIRERIKKFNITPEEAISAPRQRTNQHKNTKWQLLPQVALT